MRIVVLSRRLSRKADFADPFAVISITDPPPYSEPVRFRLRWGLRAVLPLSFHDFDPPRHDPAILIDGKPLTSWTMTAADAEAVRAFVAEHAETAKILLIHCEAGVSRSPSMAFAIADAMGWPRKVVQWGRPGMNAMKAPNGHVYRTTLAAFPELGVLASAVKAGEG
jgi:predicted protein tyrosine phosphatase